MFALRDKAYGISNLYYKIIKKDGCDYRKYGYWPEDELTDEEIQLVVDFLDEVLEDDEAELVKSYHLTEDDFCQIANKLKIAGNIHEREYAAMLMYDKAIEKLSDPSIAALVPRVFSNDAYDEAVNTVVSELNALYKNPVFERERMLKRRLAHLAEYYVFKSSRIAQNYPAVQDGYEYLNEKVLDLGLSVRTRNALTRAGVFTVREILNYPAEKWSSMRGLGRGAATELEDKIRELGFEDFSIDLTLP